MTQEVQAAMVMRSLDMTTEAFEGFRKLIYSQAGIFMSEAKRTLIASRLRKRVLALQLPCYMSYYRYITESEGQVNGELQRCIDLLTTNETYFFREEQHFDFLKEHVFPRVASNQPLRIWSAASSSGDEAYTLAILCASQLQAGNDWRIWGTDISTKVLDEARLAIYPDTRVRKVPDALRRQYLMRGTGSKEGQVCVTPELRQRVSFQQFNLVTSSLPEQSFDLIFCRNVLIYFDADTKRQVIQRLVKCLRPGGYLFSGRSESVHGMDSRLTTVMPSIYRKQA